MNLSRISNEIIILEHSDYISDDDYPKTNNDSSIFHQVFGTNTAGLAKSKCPPFWAMTYRPFLIA